MVRNNAVSSSGYQEYVARDAQYRVKWEGQIAERLGLAGQEITKENYHLVQAGIDPTTGEVLRAHLGRHQWDKSGTYIYARPRTAYDFVISAPKSVSIMAMVDERLVDAHVVAVNHVAAQMEPLALARIRINGANESRPTGEVLRGVYFHDTSRALDPHLHAHSLTVNLTFDPVEAKWKALQAVEMYKARAELTLEYRQTLVHQVHSLGYGIEWKDQIQAPRIQGVSPELERVYSQRSALRDELVSTQNRDVSPREIVRMLRIEREEKNYSLTPDDIRTIQLQRIGPNEYGQLLRIHEQAQIQAPAMRNTRLILNDGSDSEIGNVIQRWNYGQRNTKQKVS